MKLYHFLSAQHGLDAIEHQRLKVSRCDAINDPLEGSYLYALTQEGGATLDRLKEEFAANFFLLCFSRSFDDPVMWSHYADRHRGVCLGFEVNLENWQWCKDVRYCSERKLVGDKDNISQDPDILRHFSQKHPSWAYEAETRLFHPFDDAQLEKAGSLRFIPFSPNLRLTEVIIGAFSPLKLADVVNASYRSQTTVQKFRAQLRVDRVGIEKGRPFNR